MNILILSVGSRNKIIRFFKKELAGTGRVIATDCSNLAPALYEADAHYIVPRIDSSNYFDVILDICKKEDIKGIFSLIDPELSLLAQNAALLAENGATAIVSEYKVTERCLNKRKMYEFCHANNISTIKSYFSFSETVSAIEREDIQFPVFAKPINGSCSNDIRKICSIEDLQYAYSKVPDLMVQEFMNSQEIGADVYIDLISKDIISIFTKKKLLMRAGETDKAVSFKDEKLFAFIGKFVEISEFSGQIDIDIFEKDGEYLLSEVNPRFGGGYPHAYECGCNFARYIINNLEGKSNVSKIGDYETGIVMMKYLDLIIKKGEI